MDYTPVTTAYERIKRLHRDLERRRNKVICNLIDCGFSDAFRDGKASAYLEIIEELSKVISGIESNIAWGSSNRVEVSDEKGN